MRSHSPHISILLGAALLTLGIACGGLFGGDEDGCKKDTDCKGDRVCVQGKCAAPTSSALLPPSPSSARTKHPGGVYSFDCFGEDFYQTSAAQLRRYRNEIYARHGRRFKSKDLSRHFNAQPWYTPNPGFSEGDISPTDSRCLKRIRTEEKVRKENLAACPYVYLVEEGEEIFQGEILRHLDRPSKAGWQSLPLHLDRTTDRLVRVRLSEEKPETTWLDAVVLEAGGQTVRPQACAKRQAAFCEEDGRHRRLAPGETLDLVFKVRPGLKGPVHLWAAGHYRPH